MKTHSKEAIRGMVRICLAHLLYSQDRIENDPVWFHGMEGDDIQ